MQINGKLREYRSKARLGWPLIISVLTVVLIDFYGINPQNRWALIAHKFSVVTLSVILAHLVRKEMFPYLDLSAALESDQRGRAIGSAIVLATIYGAVILAVALGL